MDSASPVGRVKSTFIGNGRLRTFSSVVKLRNFELSWKKRQRDVHVGELYLVGTAPIVWGSPHFA